MIRTLQTIPCLLFLLLFVAGCEQNRLDIDVSHIQADVNIERLDQSWFQMTPVSFRKLHPQYMENYGSLYRHYIEDVLSLGSASDSNLFAEINLFVSDASIAEVQQKVQETYPDLGPQEAELSEAWKHYLHYFPGNRVPAHISFISGFNTPFAMTDSAIGIGLEMFLGRNCVFYDYLQLPLYLRARMTPKHLAPWLMKGWLETEFVLHREQPTLLDEIIHQGKILYCLDALLPQTADSLKTGYTGSQLQWAAEHEHFVWAHFVDKQLLFGTDRATIGKFTNDGPFTVDLVKESPSRMGHYIGWQIVRAYMDRQDVTDLRALMTADAQDILNQSNYKP